MQSTLVKRAQPHMSTPSVNLTINDFRGIHFRKPLILFPHLTRAKHRQMKDTYAFDKFWKVDSVISRRTLNLMRGCFPQVERNSLQTFHGVIKDLPQAENC